MDKVIIFGCGPTGLRAYEEIKNNSEIVAFFDNDKEKTAKKIDGISICEPKKEIFAQLTYDYIIIASVYGKWQIEEQLHNLGIADEKIRHASEGINILPDFLKNLAEIFEEENIEGACAEVGVFRGTNAQYINKFFPKRRLHLYDTFKGFSEKDVEVENKLHNKGVKAGEYSDTSINIVMSGMRYPEQVIIHQGFFPDTATGLDEKFCFVRIDLDLFAPTKAALEIFEPLIVKGGIVLVHDYFGNQYPGIKKVVKEFMGKHPKLSKMPIGDTMSIAITGF